MPSDCPSADELRRWLGDEAGAPALEAHVERCPACQRAVEELLAGAAPAAPTVMADSVPTFLRRLEGEAPPALGPAATPPPADTVVGAPAGPEASPPPG